MRPGVRSFRADTRTHYKLFARALNRANTISSVIQSSVLSTASVNLFGLFCQLPTVNCQLSTVNCPSSRFNLQSS
ncbi:MAG: hypothetical protein JGK01_24070 [Microcoleus sp. PH2017_03_ELD_O_A]|nr:hypothetical protein [Microcoleus sp. PH2017_04_SCI_O_A]MCC3444710.1 hypothetical protein [Microcoleus sp. PH2017_03_ELD_O_A]MCC3509801.1 hypothetical protein [Microcoleus sp. PH2017_17_BER_D_A]